MSKTSKDFRDKAITQPVQARRAERLVLALDRLLIATKWKNQKANAALDELFKEAQSLPDFDPQQFANKLDTFAQSISAESEPAHP